MAEGGGNDAVAAAVAAMPLDEPIVHVGALPGVDPDRCPLDAVDDSTFWLGEVISSTVSVSAQVRRMGLAAALPSRVRCCLYPNV
jgi:hypothetical protein